MPDSGTARGTAARRARPARSARDGSRARRSGRARRRGSGRPRRIVDRRWAIAIVVRPAISRSSAAWISRSLTGVEGRRRLVEDQDPRILQQDPRDRDPLLLAARQLVAALADDRVVAVGQLRDPVVDRRRAGRRARAPPRSRRASRRAGCPGSRRGTGTSPGSRTRSPRPSDCERDRADVVAVDLDRALVDVVEPRDQVGRRRLARARRADERHELARAGPRSRCPRARRPGELGSRHDRLGRRGPRPRRRHPGPRPRPLVGSVVSSLGRRATGDGRSPGSGTRRCGPHARRATWRASRAIASGASTISGSISRYSKIRSNSASAPWISTWTLSSWPSGKNSRLWSVVNATMSPIVGAVGSPWIAR